MNRPPADDLHEEELDPLDITYARSVCKNAKELERVQLALQTIPGNLLQLLSEQSDELLYGVATAVEALHELAGSAVLLEASNIISDDKQKKNMAAQLMAREAAQLVTLMEAFGFYCCQELVERDKEDALAEAQEMENELAKDIR